VCRVRGHYREAAETETTALEHQAGRLQVRVISGHGPNISHPTWVCGCVAFSPHDPSRIKIGNLRIFTYSERQVSASRFCARRISQMLHCTQMASLDTPGLTTLPGGAAEGDGRGEEGVGGGQAGGAASPGGGFQAPGARGCFQAPGARGCPQ